MGFSLAQMSLSFVMPAHASDIYAGNVPIAFLVTFVLVAGTWYSHHWVFDYLFVPTRATVVLNFATLASVIWLVYQLQLYVHFSPLPDHQFAATSYVLTFALTWSLLGLLYAACLRLRWNALESPDRTAALMKTGRLLVVGIGTAVCSVVVTRLHYRAELAFLCVPVLVGVWRTIVRFAIADSVTA